MCQQDRMCTLTFTTSRGRQRERASLLPTACLLAIVLSGCAQWSPSLATTREAATQVSDGIIQAIKDEIYAYDYWRLYPALPFPQPMRAYIKPHDPTQRRTFVIYRLEPYGEVYREAYVQKDGLVLLAEDPRRGFPPTKAWAMRTVDMDDDKVCKYKMAWRRVDFTLEQPGPGTLAEARQRQAERRERYFRE